ncbi:DUF2130 domain-containing protein [Nocardia sp. 2YAB30]|uniref:DUF2130 domain-containing protein n=1 Tax=unclassified Nocardia TaxID=2637762 RepID=UPI003F97D0CF
MAQKLAEDAERQGAAIAVLVSAALPNKPEKIEGSRWVDGIPVCDFATAVHLAGPLTAAGCDRQTARLGQRSAERQGRQGLRLRHTTSSTPSSPWPAY